LALARLDRISISMHCWQGDDIRGFRDADRSLSGGIQTTGNLPGRTRHAQELKGRYR
jgi:L-rhamnose isomerase